MKNKILIAIFTILTFGIFLIPKTFAFNVSQLNNVNRVTNIINNNIYFTDVNYDLSPKYVGIQCFSKDDLNTPLNMATIFGSNSVKFNYGGSGGWENMTAYTTSSNYGYRTAININNNTTFYHYINIVPSVSNTNINDYVFNVTINTSSSNVFYGVFVPNSFYYPSEGLKGIFTNTSVSLSLDGQSSIEDVTTSTLGYNTITLGNNVNTIYRQNDRNGYQYHLRVTFENGVSLLQLPNLHIKFLELEYINVNGNLYTYNDAKTRFNWLYNNIVLYNDNASLYVNNDLRLSSQYNIIYELRFRLPDYTFKSSTYYDSALGIRGYLNGVLISSFEYSNVEAYSMGFKDGGDAGYDKGYNDGLNKGLSEERGHFDNLMFAIGDVPIRIISSVLNFNILGFNLLSFFMGIITLMLFIYVLRRFKE